MSSPDLVRVIELWCSKCESLGQSNSGSMVETMQQALGTLERQDADALDEESVKRAMSAVQREIGIYSKAMMKLAKQSKARRDNEKKSGMTSNAIEKRRDCQFELALVTYLYGLMCRRSNSLAWADVAVRVVNVLTRLVEQQGTNDNHQALKQAGYDTVRVLLDAPSSVQRVRMMGLLTRENTCCTAMAQQADAVLAWFVRAVEEPVHEFVAANDRASYTFSRQIEECNHKLAALVVCLNALKRGAVTCESTTDDGVAPAAATEPRTDSTSTWLPLAQGRALCRVLIQCLLQGHHLQKSIVRTAAHSLVFMMSTMFGMQCTSLAIIARTVSPSAATPAGIDLYCLDAPTSAGAMQHELDQLWKSSQMRNDGENTSTTSASETQHADVRSGELPPISCLALILALVNVVDAPHVWAVRVAPDDSSQLEATTTIEATTGTTTSAVLQLLLPCVAEYCRTAVEGPLQYMGLQSLALAFTKLVATPIREAVTKLDPTGKTSSNRCGKHGDKVLAQLSNMTAEQATQVWTSIDKSLGMSPWTLADVLRKQLTPALDVVVGCWDAPMDKVSVAVRDAFRELVGTFQLVATLHQQCEARADHARRHSPSRDILQSVLRGIVQQAYVGKGALSALLVLVEQGGVAALLEAEPAILRILLDVSTVQHTRKVVTALLALVFAHVVPNVDHVLSRRERRRLEKSRRNASQSPPTKAPASLNVKTTTSSADHVASAASTTATRSSGTSVKWAEEMMQWVQRCVRQQHGASHDEEGEKESAVSEVDQPLHQQQSSPWKLSFAAVVHVLFDIRRSTTTLRCLIVPMLARVSHLRTSQGTITAVEEASHATHNIPRGNVEEATAMLDGVTLALLHARRAGLFDHIENVREILAGTDFSVQELIGKPLRGGHTDECLAALEVVCFNKMKGSPPSEEELQMALTFVRHCSKAPANKFRQHSCVLLQGLLVRLRDFVMRALACAVENKPTQIEFRRQLEQEGGAWAVALRARVFLNQVIASLLRDLCPGAAMARLFFASDLLLCIVDTWPAAIIAQLDSMVRVLRQRRLSNPGQSEADDEESEGKQTEGKQTIGEQTEGKQTIGEQTEGKQTDDVEQVELYTCNVFVVLLSLLQHDFADARRMALKALSQFPRDVFVEAAQVIPTSETALLQWALRMLFSVRAREGEAGAVALLVIAGAKLELDRRSMLKAPPSKKVKKQTVLVGGQNALSTGLSTSSKDHVATSGDVPERDEKWLACDPLTGTVRLLTRDEAQERQNGGDEEEQEQVLCATDAMLNTWRQLVRILEQQCVVAEVDLLQAATIAPLHGTSAAIRVLLELQQVDQHVKDACRRALTPHAARAIVSEWQMTVQQTIDVACRALDCVRPAIVSAAPEGFVPGGKHEVRSGTRQQQVDKAKRFLEGLRGKDTYEGKEAQLVSVCCWNGVREIAQLLSSMVAHLSLGRVTEGNKNDTATNDNEGDDDDDELDVVLIDEVQVERIGTMFLELLLSARHKGAIEKMYVSFQELCTTLMRRRASYRSSHSIRGDEDGLSALPSTWLALIQQRVVTKSLLTHTRRSAGLPFGVAAILCAEQEAAVSSGNRGGGMLQLLPSLLQFLLRVADGKSTSAVNTNTNKDGEDIINEDGDERLFLQTDEFARVHALNILRHVFREGTLATSLLPYAAEAFQVVIRAFRSANWAVRNSATMLFTVLSARTIGVSVRDRLHAARFNIASFFVRYASLREYFYRFLDDVTASQEERTKDKGNVALTDSTSLFGILTLFASLSPSEHDLSDQTAHSAPRTDQDRTESTTQKYRGKEVELADFVPLVERCAGHPNGLVRRMAARAVVPFLRPDENVSHAARWMAIVTRDAQQVGAQEAHGLLLMTLSVLDASVARVRATDASAAEAYALATRQVCASVPSVIQRWRYHAAVMSVALKLAGRVWRWRTGQTQEQWQHGRGDRNGLAAVASGVSRDWLYDGRRHVAPFTSLVRRRAAKFLTRLHTSQWEATGHSDVVRCSEWASLLLHPTYEVAEATLQQWQWHVETSHRRRNSTQVRASKASRQDDEHGQVSKEDGGLAAVWALVKQLIWRGAEGDTSLFHGVLSNALKLVPSLRRAAKEDNDVELFSDVLQCVRHGQGDVREVALQVSGVWGGSALPEALRKAWLQLLAQYSTTDNVEQWRMACARAMADAIQGGIGHQSGEWQLLLWRLVVRMMVDDSEDVRDVMSEALHRGAAEADKRGGGDPLHRMWHTWQRQPVDNETARAKTAWLRRVVETGNIDMAIGDALKPVMGETEEVWDSDWNLVQSQRQHGQLLSRWPLFKPEPPNIWMEPLPLVTLAIESYFGNDGIAKKDTQTTLCGQLEAVLEKVTTWGRAHRESVASGWLLYQADVFHVLYRVVQALNASGPLLPKQQQTVARCCGLYRMLVTTLEVDQPLLSASMATLAEKVDTMSTGEA